LPPQTDASAAGDREEKVARTLIKLRQPPKPHTAGRLVDALYRDDGNFYPGKVVEARADGKLDVLFADGDFAEGLAIDEVLEREGADAAGADAGAADAAGDVEEQAVEEGGGAIGTLPWFYKRCLDAAPDESGRVSLVGVVMPLLNLPEVLTMGEDDDELPPWNEETLTDEVGDLVDADGSVDFTDLGVKLVEMDALQLGPVSDDDAY